MRIRAGMAVRVAAIVVGHELTHSIDAVGRLYDANGGPADMWSLDTEVAFETRAQCPIDQFSAYEG